MLNTCEVGGKRKRVSGASLRPMKLGSRLRELGHGSNKDIRKLLRRGSVFVNGLVERNISRRVTEDFDVAVFDASDAESPGVVSPTVYVYNKRCGLVTSSSDELGRVDVYSEVPKDFDLTGLHCIGRLDQHSTGLLLFTNDGQLTKTLLDPASKIEREYVCLVVGEVDFLSLKSALSGGIETRFGTLHGDILSANILSKNDNRRNLFEHYICMKDGVMLRQDGPRPFSNQSLPCPNLSEIRIRLYEGKKRHVRRLLAYAGHDVINLKRVRYGGFQLGELKEGQMRHMNKIEKDWVVQNVLPLQHKNMEAKRSTGAYNNE